MNPPTTDVARDLDALANSRGKAVYAVHYPFDATNQPGTFPIIDVSAGTVTNSGLTHEQAGAILNISVSADGTVTDPQN